MSIAVSALVVPSRTARRLLLAWGLAQLAAAFAVATLPMIWDAGPWLAAMLAGAGLALAGSAARPPKTHRIDISGTGELRVTVQQDVRPAHAVGRAAGGAGSGPDGAGGQMPPPRAVLLPGSVLWPGLMLLNLAAVAEADVADAADAADAAGVARAGRGRQSAPMPRVLPIWRDSVDGDAWRALAVALAVIGKPGQGEGGKNR